MQIAQLIAEGVSALQASDSPRLDVEVLLAHALGCDRAKLRAYPELIPDEPALRRYRALLSRRKAGEPVAHLTGQREFWSLSLKVTPDTLIPRPETERLVELALQHLQDIDQPRIADLGTGTGAIALAIASERRDATVVATDVSPAALAVARDNAASLGIRNVSFRHGDWCEALGDERFAMIVSNPPYIPDADPHLREGDICFEPRGALAADVDGLRDLRRIITCSMMHLVPGGWLLLEHGYDQAAAVTGLLRAAGYDQVNDVTDLAGQPRVGAGQRPDTR